MSGRRRFALFLCALSALAAVAVPASAQLRLQTIRWEDTQNARSDVTAYRVHYGTAPRTYTTSLDVGVPPLVGGVMETAIQVPSTGNVYIAITAMSGDLESFYSNEICRDPQGPCGDEPDSSDPTSDPTSEPAPSGAQAAIVGFALWNAQTDTLFDGDFRSGEAISLDLHGSCVAIEILGNAYLRDSGPGSVMKAFDGDVPASCSTPGVTHENSAPYAWEQDEGPNLFACAASLQEPGTHTLQVTPYDGDDCSGAAGAAVTLQFEVLSTATSEPLGQPGQPKLVD